MSRFLGFHVVKLPKNFHYPYLEEKKRIRFCLQRYCQNISISSRKLYSADCRAVHFQSSLYLYEIVWIFILSFPQSFLKWRIAYPEKKLSILAKKWRKKKRRTEIETSFRLRNRIEMIFKRMMLRIDNFRCARQTSLWLWKWIRKDVKVWGTNVE